MFIDDTYFKGDIKLSPNSNQISDFNSFIVKKEKEYLISLLGYDLYKSFIAGYTAPIPKKWKNLAEGCEYQVTDENGNLVYVEWKGLKNTLKESFLAYFIYYEWQKITQTTPTPQGEFKTQNENSTNAPNYLFNQKIVSAYNKGVDMYGVDLDELTDKNWFIKGKDFPEVNNEDYFDLIQSGSAFNFLYFANLADNTTYPNWKFTPINKINMFGI